MDKTILGGFEISLRVPCQQFFPVCFEIKCQFRQEKNLTKSSPSVLLTSSLYLPAPRYPRVTTEGKHLTEVIKQMDTLKLDLVFPEL